MSSTPVTQTGTKAPGRFRRALSRLTVDEQEIDSRDLRDEAASAGATAVVRCTRGEPVCVAGTISAVVLRPRAGVPTLEAEVYDGTGTVTLVWLGRRRIRGIDAGRSLVARGRMTHHDGRPAIYNPAYELRPTGA
ncbi:MAG: DNA-binding protein [Frankiales bacterium]|nr:DNA-binding protein [Frankiales bacterium]